MKKENKGITLIALVITIIVLLILAAVSIATLTGDNGILTKAQTASEKTKEASVKEEIETEIMAAFDNTGKFDAEAFKKRMNEIGAEITEETEDEIVVEKDGYGATIDAKTGKITNFEKSGVTPEIEVTVGEYDGVSKKVTLTVEVTNDVGQVDSITITNLDTGETYEAKVSGKTGSYDIEKNGTYKIEVKATTDGEQKTKEATETVGKIPVTFTTAQGKIDVIWVNTNNEKIEEPLAPVLKEMKKVYWEEDGTEKKEGDTEFTESEWYDYVAGDNKNDTKMSKWANAINTIKGVDSYFVWVPRYAYRITYYADKECTQVAGYCDGDGIRDVAGNKKPATQNLKEDKGIETVEYNGFKYIVHPAFVDESELTVPYKNGGWDEDLQGIWVGKYESARSTATAEDAGSGTTAIQIAPTVKSWVIQIIEDCYTNAFNYDRDKESHLMKNSEWGAVAYLTYSQYGRNRNEVDINRCSGEVTGMGNGDSTYYSYSSATSEQKYDGTKGQLTSSTGNIYGVYDLNGGTMEFVAAFNNVGSILNYGSTFAGTDGNSKESTKYATKYSSDSSTPTYEKYYPGDATFEIYNGSDNIGWNSESSYFVLPSSPFFRRGGRYGGGGRCVLFVLLLWRFQQPRFVPCGLAWRVTLCVVTLNPKQIA